MQTRPTRAALVLLALVAAVLTLQAQSLTLSPSSATILVGQTVQLSASPSSGTKWFCSNCSVATVNGTGLVRGRTPGVATITARRGNRTASATITVSSATPPPTQQSPIAVLTYVSGGLVGQLYTVNTAGTFDPDGSIAYGTINWGDGNTTTYTGAVPYSHIYAVPGAFTITLSVTDATALSATATQTATLTAAPPPNQPPVAHIAQVVSNILVGQPMTVSTVGTFDPDGSIASGTLTWGDGQQTSISGPPAATYTHTYATAGTKTVTFLVSDGSLTSTASISITIGALPNVPPVVQLALVGTAFSGSPATISTAGTVDSDGTLVSGTLVWGDGSQQSIVGAPAATYTHTYAAATSFTVSLTVVDNNGSSATGTLVVAVQSPASPPVDCVLSDWSAWSTCSIDGQQTRTRTVLVPASNGGLACGPLTETRTCTPPPVPVDCVLSAWSEFGACTNGQQTRTRTIITPPSNGGAACGPLTETQSCSLPTPPGSASVNLTTQEALYPGSTTGIARTNEPLTVGIPFPDDPALGVDNVSNMGITGATVGQFRCLAVWSPSGRCKWVLVDTLLPSLAAGAQSTALTVTTAGTGNFGGSNLATDNGSTITINTGAAVITVRKANFNGLNSVVIGGATVVAAGASQGFVVVGPAFAGVFPANVTCSPDSGGSACTTEYSSANDASSTCTVEENGPVRAALKCDYALKDSGGNLYLRGTARLHFYSGKTYAKVVSVLRNADDGSSNTFATAYKGHRGYEFRTTLNIGSGPNTYTIANHTATPTTGTLSGSDSAYLFQGISSLMQYVDNPIAYQMTDSGYAIAKNGSNVQTGTAAQGPQGWCDISSNGVGLEVGVYQLAGSYPKGCRYGSAGQVSAISILPAQSTTPYYMEWPQWDEYTTTFLNFHTSAPASLANDFLKLQHPLLARANYAYYNLTNVFPTLMLSALAEDTYTTTVAEAASPSISSGNKWAINNVTQAQDFGTTSSNWPLDIVRTFSWNLESDYRYGYLLSWITRGWTGRYLFARHFYEYQTAYMLAHSDGFDWRTGHGAPGGAILNGFGYPTGIVSANSTKGTHGANEHNWRDQEHGFWYGQPQYYLLSGDEFQKDAMLDQQKDWFLTPNTYQDVGGFGSNQGDISGTTFTKDAGSAFTSQLIGQTLLLDTTMTPYVITAVPDGTHLTLATAAPTPLNDRPYIVADGSHGLFNARSQATQYAGGARFASLLQGFGDSDYANVLTNLQHLFDFQVKSQVCMAGYPSGCTFGSVGTPATWVSLGLNRQRGAAWGASGSSGYWCGVPNAYRVNSIFQEALLGESLRELRDYRGPSWADYTLAGDLSYGIAQWALSEGWYGSGSATSNATNGFRFGLAFDVANNCPVGWTVDISGTTVTRTAGPDFVTDGTWTSSYAVMADGTSAFVCGGVPRTIVSVTNTNTLTIAASSSGTGVSCVWREQNFDEPNANGALTNWPHYFNTQAVTGDVSWQAKFNLSMQRSMSRAGLSFRDLNGYHLQHTMALLTGTAAPVLTTLPITGFFGNGSGTYTISWASVANGPYRVKWGPKILVDFIGFNPNTNLFTGDPATTMNWFAGTDVTTAPTCVSGTCSVTIPTGLTGLTAGNFSVKSTATSSGGGGTISGVSWTNQPHTAGWPGYNGYLEDVFDPVSNQVQHYGIISTSSSIYSTNQFAYNVATNLWTTIGGNNTLTSTCPSTWPTWPPDRHPVGQMAVDTLRNRLWMVGGVCGGVVQQDMAYMTLNANPASNTWTRVVPTTLPNALLASGMVYDAATDALLLFGPNSGSILQIWIYCPSASLSQAQITAGCTSPQDWAQVSFSGGPFLGDSFPRTVYSVARGQTVIFGGMDNSTPTNDLWTYTTATKTLAQRCASPCTPPPVYTGPGSPPTYPFVEIPSAGVFFYHQTYNTGAPRDWTFTFGTTPAADVWAVLPSSGSGPSSDAVGVYDPVHGKVYLWTRNPGSGAADVWIGAIK